MHTRRVGAFLIGAWLVGSLLTAFLASQTLAGVDRLLANPPALVAKELDDMGSDVARSMFRYQAAEANRRMFDGWQVLQLGLGGALLATAVLTAHRSKFLIGGAVLMLLIVALQAFYFTPTMNALSRSFDFLPQGAPSKERDSFQNYHAMYMTAEVLKILTGLVVTARLLFDRYNWKEKLLPAPDQKVRRRRRVHRGDEPAEPAVESE